MKKLEKYKNYSKKLAKQLKVVYNLIMLTKH